MTGTPVSSAFFTRASDDFTVSSMSKCVTVFVNFAAIATSASAAAISRASSASWPVPRTMIRIFAPVFVGTGTSLIRWNTATGAQRVLVVTLL